MPAVGARVVGYEGLQLAVLTLARGRAVLRQVLPARMAPLPAGQRQPLQVALGIPGEGGSWVGVR
eukprot:scaffold43903_cov40-Phaeocystis_antarctica.AAC.2